VNVLEVLHAVGALLVWTAAAMLVPLGFAVGDGLVWPWVASVLITAIAGSVLWFGTPRQISINPREGLAQISINPREGLAVVALGWIAVVLAGSLPFIFTGVAPTVPAALFESVSGFTTTGATVFPEIEALPSSILLWRSVSHWLGGMGIIVLGVAILPMIPPECRPSDSSPALPPRPVCYGSSMRSSRSS
jgi:trk system potassium uptake protein TrkH